MVCCPPLSYTHTHTHTHTATHRQPGPESSAHSQPHPIRALLPAAGQHKPQAYVRRCQQRPSTIILHHTHTHTTNTALLHNVHHSQSHRPVAPVLLSYSLCTRNHTQTLNQPPATRTPCRYTTADPIRSDPTPPCQQCPAEPTEPPKQAPASLPRSHVHTQIDRARYHTTISRLYGNQYGPPHAPPAS